MKQYKLIIKTWGFEKNIPQSDMRAIIRKEQKRRAHNGSKASTFRLRHRPVPDQKIERYKRTHDITDETLFSDARTWFLSTRCILSFANVQMLATPSDISCETPRSLHLSRHITPIRSSTPLIDDAALVQGCVVPGAYLLNAQAAISENAHRWGFQVDSSITSRN